MEKVLIILSTLTHNHNFMLWFWFFATIPVAIWQVFYFPAKKQLTEKELAEISPEFKNINADYVVFSIFAIGLLIGFPLLVLAPSLDKWAVQNFGIEFYPSMTMFSAGYGIYQGLFALIKGVYPMAKSLTYAYDDAAKVRRAAKYQIVISIAAVVFVTLFFFATV